MALQHRFHDLLVRAAAELYQDHRDRMRLPDLIPTPNAIDDADLVLFFEGLDCGLIRLERNGRFNTLDRPIPGGRWARCLVAATAAGTTPSTRRSSPPTVELVRRLGYPPGRVLFELP